MIPCKECRVIWTNEEARIFVCPACGFSDRLHPALTLSQVHTCCPKANYGLGDIVATALEVTGIAPLVRRLRGGKCGGCKQRQQALNDLGKKVGF